MADICSWSSSLWWRIGRGRTWWRSCRGSACAFRNHNAEGDEEDGLHSRGRQTQGCFDLYVPVEGERIWRLKQRSRTRNPLAGDEENQSMHAGRTLPCQLAPTKIFFIWSPCHSSRPRDTPLSLANSLFHVMTPNTLLLQDRGPENDCPRR